MSTVDLTSANFEKTITDSDIVIVDFWAAWCGPCQMFAPVLEQSSNEHPDVVHAKVDTDANQDLAAAFGISSIPTLMVFREGILVFRQPGALGGPQLRQVVEGVKGLDMDDVRKQIEEAQAKQQN